MLRPASPEVLCFCQDAGLAPYLPKAFQLIRAKFPGVNPTGFSLVPDPCEEGQMLLVHLRVNSTPEVAFARQDEFNLEWIRAVPNPVRDRLYLEIEFA